MKLLFKQRFFSWLDSYDIFNEAGETVYTVEGRLSWGHCLEIHDAADRHLGTIKEEILAFLPRFNIFLGDRQVGTIRKEFSLFKPSFTVDCCGWEVSGDFFEWEYEILEGSRKVASISKELFNWTDTYTIDIADPRDALMALMVVLTIDAVKCSQRS